MTLEDLGADIEAEIKQVLFSIVDRLPNEAAAELEKVHRGARETIRTMQAINVLVLDPEQILRHMRIFAEYKIIEAVTGRAFIGKLIRETRRRGQALTFPELLELLLAHDPQALSVVLR